MEKTLRDILYGTPLKEVIGTTDYPVAHLTFDSRTVQPGSLFVAIKGVSNDGHNYIASVIEKGCRAIVCEHVEEKVPNVNYIIVDSAAKALGVIASNFYDNPSSHLKLVGITGTNGKTTTTTLLHQLFTNLGYEVGLISTVVNKIGTKDIPSTHTTPNPIVLNELLAAMVEEGCTYCFMEVSSHAIHQQRIAGVAFTGAVFSNITHDHLDYHGTFKEYINAKKAFFDQLSSKAFALTNADDKNGMVMLQNTIAKKYTYGIKSLADFKLKVLENQFSGLVLSIEGTEVWTKLIGDFNAYNMLAVYAVSQLLEQDKIEVLTEISKLGSVNGRFEYTISTTGITAIIDYAHTPDALQNVLQTIGNIRTGNETVFTVVGCGGDRDKTKRPKMAEIACELGDKVILTSDNPRSEDPQVILQEMMAGVGGHHYKKTLSITDRREAIKTAVSMAEKGDIILIAGKGHETYQEIKGVKHDFDDKAIVNELFIKLEK